MQWASATTGGKETWYLVASIEISSTTAARDPIPGTREQIRCRPCNALKSRVWRVCQNDEQVNIGYKELNDDERKELNAAAGSIWVHEFSLDDDGA